jgi:hypothetical protein
VAASAPPDTTQEPPGRTVHLLHRWDRHTDTVTLHHDHSSALAALAAALRADWEHLPGDGPRPSPDGLGDAEVVLAVYGEHSRQGPDGVCSGDLGEDGGFTITVEAVHGPTTPPPGPAMAAPTIRTPTPSDASLTQRPLSAVERRRRARHYNRAPHARFHPATTDHEVPTLRVAGALVSVYINPDAEQCTLSVGVDLDTCVPELIRAPDGTVPVEITVQGQQVYPGPDTTVDTARRS